MQDFYSLHESNLSNQEPAVDTFKPAPNSLLNSKDISWELLINNVLKSISDLNYSAKNLLKGRYLQEAIQVIIAIRDMLGCSGAAFLDAAILKSNKSLQLYHENITNSLAKNYVAAKIASGAWPPPDAVHKMRYQAGQVLLSVRHFVAVAQDIEIILVPAFDDKISEFDVLVTKLSNHEFRKNINLKVESTLNSLTELVEEIKNSEVFSGTVGEKVQKIATDIGQLISMIQDIPESENNLHQRQIFYSLNKRKEDLHSALFHLLKSVTKKLDTPQCSDNAVLESATSVLDTFKDFMIIIKKLPDNELILSFTNFQEFKDDLKESPDLQVLMEKTMRLNLIPLDPESGLSDNSQLLSSYSSGLASSTISDPNFPFSADSSQKFKRQYVSQMHSPEYKSSSNSTLKSPNFFGEETYRLQSGELNQPWFLKQDFNNDLSYNMEGAVNGGTFSALVELLTSHERHVGKQLSFR